MSADSVDFKAVILARFPELSGARFSLLTKGFDSIAVDVDDRLIFKFPRSEDAALGLIAEASLLAAVRPFLMMPVPDLELFREPLLFSRHAKLRGEHLLDTDYEALPEMARDELAADLALFYAQLHALDRSTMAAAGAKPIEAWLGADEILRQAWPVLPATLRPLAERTISAWQALPPDPCGLTYGFYDGHGWNMAYDHARHKLNGIYDFADSGFGALHQDFIYASFISLELTARIVTAYERLTARPLDRERIDLLTGVFWLSELGSYTEDPVQFPIAQKNLMTWAAVRR